MGKAQDQLLGKVAVASKAITETQLADALHAQAQLAEPKPLAEVLLALGLVDRARLAKILTLAKQVIAKARERRKSEGSTSDEASGASSEAAGAAAGTDGHAIGLEPSSDEAGPPAALPVREPDAPIGDLATLLRTAVESGVSDVQVHSGAPLKFRLHQRLYDHGSGPLTAEQAADLLLPALPDVEREAFESRGEHDFCLVLEGVGRFRANIYRQLRGIDASFRHIPPEPPTLASLGLPEDLARFTKYHQGMVLCTGPARCGKSSTMAALVNLVNHERTDHILTIEDPIEHLHTSKGCLVNQRSVHRHTESFARALRAALREDPDVIVIGELRDTETISLALTAAETGHFVLATLHTDNAIRTINRLIGAFPPDQQEQVRAMLGESLKAVISQRLVPTADEQGLAAALEILIVNRAVGNLIREQKTVQIHSTLQTGLAHGMCLLDHSLAQLVRAGTVSREEALRFCEDPRALG